MYFEIHDPYGEWEMFYTWLEETTPESDPDSEETRAFQIMRRLIQIRTGD